MLSALLLTNIVSEWVNIMVYVMNVFLYQYWEGHHSLHKSNRPPVQRAVSLAMLVDFLNNFWRHYVVKQIPKINIASVEYFNRKLKRKYLLWTTLFVQWMSGSRHNIFEASIFTNKNSRDTRCVLETVVLVVTLYWYSLCTGISSPRLGSDDFPLPAARHVSARVHRDASQRHEHGVTFMFAVWGQLVDHDLTLTAETKGKTDQLKPSSS